MISPTITRIPSSSMILVNPARKRNINLAFMISPSSNNSFVLETEKSSTSFPITDFLALATTNNDAKYGIFGGNSNILPLFSILPQHEIPIIQQLVQILLYGVGTLVIRHNPLCNIVNVVR